MADERRDTGPAIKRVLLGVLFGCALFGLWGCDGGPLPPTTVDRGVTVPSDRTEAQLLAELDRRWENPQVHYELARLYHRSQQWSKAGHHYDVALGFEPANRAAQAGLVKMYIDRGETAKAEQSASSYLRQAAGSLNETLRLAREFQQVGLDEYALRGFRQALDAAPDSFEANRQIGFYYLGKGDRDQAKKYLMRSFELNPRQPDVAGALGRLGVAVEAPKVYQEAP